MIFVNGHTGNRINHVIRVVHIMHANNFHYYANSLCSQNVTIMLKKSHYYAVNFSPDQSFFYLK